MLERTRGELAARAAERDAWRVRAEKGCGHKEIAQIQQKSERTVRQHAVAVYRKSGLSGRAELAAFFLEDLLLPASEGASPAS